MWYGSPLDSICASFWEELLTQSSGIFGYINYLVERDRKFILDTLLNGW